MIHAEKSSWALTAAAVLCAVCGLLAFNGLEVQALDETIGLGSKCAAALESPSAYRAEGRSDIMIGAAGGVLN